MGLRLDDARNLVSTILMGWASKLATRQYQHQLARYIQLGMHMNERAEEMPEYAVIVSGEHDVREFVPTSGEWVNII